MASQTRSTATKVVVASTVMLAFISFWRAAAIVLSDLGSTVYYIGGIAEQAIGRPFDLVAPEDRKLMQQAINQGVALSAKRMGCRAVIVMPTTTPKLKIDAVGALGGEVVLAGESFSDAYQHALHLEKKEKLTFVHPFDDPDVIAGQGTIAMEILRQDGWAYAPKSAPAKPMISISGLIMLKLMAHA